MRTNDRTFRALRFFGPLALGLTPQAIETPLQCSDRGPRLFLSLVLLGLLSLPAFSQEAAPNRDEEIFGAETPVPPSTPGGDAQAPAAATPPAGNTEARIEGKLRDKEQTTTIGGELHLIMAYEAVDDRRVDEDRLFSPSFFDLFLDGRPNDRLRGFVRGRLTHDFTVKKGELDQMGQPVEPTVATLDQLWLKFDLLRKIYVTVGRQPVRWGAGQIWNPTDFLNLQRKDPLAVMDKRLGVGLVKLHLPIESLGWNLYAVANLDDAANPDQVGSALRAEMVFGKTELALCAAARRNQPLRFGLDVSSGVGDFDLRLEAAVLHGDKQKYWKGDFDAVNRIFADPYSREDDWIPQVSAGGDVAIRYSDQDNVVVGTEFFYNDAGYANPDLYPWLLVQNQLTFFYVGRYYAAAYAILAQPGSWNDTTFMLTAIGNLSDNTWITRFLYQVNLITNLSLSAYAALHLGDQGEFKFHLTIPKNTDLSGLENGIDLHAPILDLGLWLTLKV